MAFVAILWYTFAMPDPSTLSMNISLPEALKRLVDAQVDSGMYGSVSEFVREAIREKLQRQQEQQRAKEQLIANLLDGLNSGPGIVVDENTFKDKKKRLLEKLDRAGEQPRDERRAS
jgi:antitoxin ParD1/3/4